MARTTFGNTNMPKFCLQSLVRITSNELLHHDIIDLIGMCLKGDDGELIYWAAGLMHEFVMQNIASDQFREIKGIHAILMGLLSVDEIYISRVALRVIKFMSSGQSSGQIKFRQEIVRIGMVKKIMHCLSMDDDGIKYRVVLCINAIAVQAESHHDILSSPEFETLIDLTISTRVKVSIYIANILSSICCTSKL
ncbi:hypothetical protein BDB01DRAFT_716414 [Pilobolus umbonatus]|nr:hypothetical protein BDB01DRAFT_716414 [Pilobolus umbonatus]